MYEKDGLAPSLAEKLGAMGYTLKERGHIADAPGIGRDGDTWIGVAEPRRLGGLASAP
jgi:gamma-glutamyltranspeptidase/glutathione hydrolase